MSILLCAATEFEIAPTLQFLRERKAEGIQVLITGVGMMATAYHLTKAVHPNRPRFLLQAGVAGCLDESLPLTKIVAVENEIIGDLGVEEKGQFLDLFQMGLAGAGQFPFTDGKLRNPVELLKQSGLKIVDGVTVNEVTTNPVRISHYRRLGATAESLEGAALHYVGLMENLPFLQLRSLSNFAGERNKEAWLLQSAIATLNQELQRLIIKLFNI